MMKKHKIHNIKTLLHEKRRLRYHVDAQEEELKVHAAFFGEHYGTIIWEKINPLKGTGLLSIALRYLTGDLLPLIIGIDDHKEHSLISQLLAKGVKGTVISKAVKLLKNWLQERESSAKTETAGETRTEEKTEVNPGNDPGAEMDGKPG